MTILYKLTPRAYLAIVLDKIDLDDFIKKAPENSILNAMAAFISYS